MKRIIFVLLICLIHFKNGYADNISLQEVLQHMVDNHPSFRIQDSRISIAEKDLEQESGGEDWRLHARTRYQHTDYEDIDNSTRKVKELTTSIGRSLWSFGGKIHLSHHLSIEDQENRFNERSNFNALSASLNIPLWKNFGGIVSQSHFTFLGHQLRESHINVEERKERSLTHVAHNFVNLASYYEMSQAHSQTRELISDITAKPETVEPNTDNEQRHSVYINSLSIQVKGALASSLRKYKKTQYELAQFLELQLLKSNDPKYDLFSTHNIESTDNVLNSIASSSRRLKAHRVSKQRLDHQKTVAENSKNPKLNLDLSISNYGSGESFAGSYDHDVSRYSATLTFDYPIGNTAAKSRLDKVNIRRMKQDDLYLDTKQLLESDALGLINSLQAYREILDINRERVKLAAKQRKLDLDMFLAQKIDISFLTNSINAEINAKIEYISNATKYQHAYIDYQELLDLIYPLNQNQEIAQIQSNGGNLQ